MYTSKQTTVNPMIAKWVINDSSEGLSQILFKHNCILSKAGNYR